MTKERLSNALPLLALNLLAFSGLFPANAPATAAEDPADRADAAMRNAASLTAIESSWLEVPRHCKAKGFNAEPVSVERLPLAAEVAAIYASA